MNELKPVKHPLIYNAPGDYYPAIDGATVVWRRDTTGDALCAVHVPNIANVRKFAVLVRVECYEQEGER